jgi:hypothetical protein
MPPPACERPAVTSSPISAEFLGSGVFLTLDLQPRQPAAIALIDDLTQRIARADSRRKNRRRERGETKLRQAVGAIVGGLLRAWWHKDGPRPVGHSNAADAFTPKALGQIPFQAGSHSGAERRPAVGRRLFKTVIDGLKAEMLIEHKRGFFLPPNASFRMGQGGKGKSARYWPTPKLLRLSEASGLDSTTIAAAFLAPRPARVVTPRALVQLRPFKVQPWQSWRQVAAPALPQIKGSRQQDGRPPSGLAEDVQAQNELAAATEVTFPTETRCYHPQWLRVFHASWHLQGRWYPYGHGGDLAAGQVGSYAGLKAAQRAMMLIGGMPVVELDVHASQLTLLLGLSGQPLPDHDDLYELHDYDRAVVKQWVLETCGKGRPPTRWSRKLPADAPARAERIGEVGAAVVRRFPALKQPDLIVPDDLVAEIRRPAHELVTHYLAAREAEAMTSAMRRLRQQGILALPVHDSLIVPASAQEAAREAIAAGYQAVCRLVPHVRDKNKARPNS